MKRALRRSFFIGGFKNQPVGKLQTNRKRESAVENPAKTSGWEGWKKRGTAAGLHLLASVGVAALAGVLVYLVWYPDPYDEVAGGSGLFRLLVAVDVVLGPLLTFVVFDRSKPRRKLWRDMAVVLSLQLAALGYGLWTVFEVRPVYLVHEVDRFTVVTAVDIDPLELSQAQPEFRKLPWFGVRVIGVRASKGAAERLEAIESGLAGKDVSRMPKYWQALDDGNRAMIRARARELAFLRAKAKDGGQALDAAVQQTGLASAQLLALPMVGQQDDWSVLMDRRDLRIVGFVHIDGF